MSSFTPEQRRARGLREAASRLNEQSRDFREAQGREPTLEERKKLQAVYYTEVAKIERDYREEVKRAEEKRLDEDQKSAAERLRIFEMYEQGVQQAYDELYQNARLVDEQEAARITAATEALNEQEEAARKRAEALREVNAEISRGRREFEELQAGAAGPEALRDFMQRRAEGLSVLIDGLQQPAGNTEHPESAEEGARREAQINRLLVERERLMQRMRDLSRQIDADHRRLISRLAELSMLGPQTLEEMEEDAAGVRSVDEQIRREGLPERERRRLEQEDGVRGRVREMLGPRADPAEVEKWTQKWVTALKPAGKMKTDVAGVAHGIADFAATLKSGSSSVSGAIAALLQALAVAGLGASFGPIGAAVGAIGGILGFDSPYDDSQARRWGFDLGTVMRQGIGDAFRSPAVAGAGAGAGAGGGMNVTINQTNHGVSAQVDMDRNNRDLTDSLWRSLRTLKKN